MASLNHPESLPKVKLSIGNRLGWMLFQGVMMVWMNAAIWRDPLLPDDTKYVWLALTLGVTALITYFLVWLGSHLQRHLRFPKTSERTWLLIWVTLLLFFINPAWTGFPILLGLLLLFGTRTRKRGTF